MWRPSTSIAGTVRPVEMNERVRQPPLRTNELFAIALEIVRGRSALEERLSLQDEPSKPLVQLVRAHVERLPVRVELRKGADRRL